MDINNYTGLNHLKAQDFRSSITNLLLPEVSSDFKVIDEVCIRDIYKTNSFVKPNSLWLDIGANIGTFSIMVYKNGGKTICYEPHPRNISKLKQLGFNVNECAVQNFNGKGKLYIQKTDHWRHTIYPTRGRQSINIDIIDSKYLPQCDGIKIDAEGAELDIIYSLQSFPEYLVFEYDGGKHKLKSTYDSLISYLQTIYCSVNYKSLKNDINFFPNGLIVICYNKKI